MTSNHSSVSSDRPAAETTVSDAETTVPASVREALGIADGDRLRWQLADDGTVRVRVVRTETGTFADFEGYDGDEPTDVVSDHDAWGLDEP
jgi:bifunctional DNA-binding transcriptional regulator/antitoxin component of YhaV-PrlF toxin-antitoxin module